jgi:transcriptional regulator with XRE-family HTH domain
MTILRIEKGQVTNMQLQTLRALAKVLGVAVEALLDEQDERPTWEKVPVRTSPPGKAAGRSRTQRKTV